MEGNCSGSKTSAGFFLAVEHIFDRALSKKAIFMSIVQHIRKAIVESSAVKDKEIFALEYDPLLFSQSADSIDAFEIEILDIRSYYHDDNNITAGGFVIGFGLAVGTDVKQIFRNAGFGLSFTFYALAENIIDDDGNDLGPHFMPDTAQMVVEVGIPDENSSPDWAKLNSDLATFLPMAVLRMP